MSLIGRSCTVCGRRTEGTARCADHKTTAGGRLRPCVTCGKPSAGNYCQDHKPVTSMEQRRATQTWRANYNSPEYRRNRREALRRDDWRCVVCARGKVQGVRIEVDHVVSIVDGGTNDVTNLVTLCADHHREKTNADRARRRQR